MKQKPPSSHSNSIQTWDLTWIWPWWNISTTSWDITKHDVNPVTLAASSTLWHCTSKYSIISWKNYSRHKFKTTASGFFVPSVTFGWTSAWEWTSSLTSNYTDFAHLAPPATKEPSVSSVFQVKLLRLKIDSLRIPQILSFIMALSMAINWAFQIFRQNKATLSVSARGIPSSQPALCRLFMANLCCPAKKEKQKL